MIVAPIRTEPRTNKNLELRFATSRPLNSTSNHVAPSPSVNDDGVRLVVERLLQRSNYRPVQTVRCLVVDGVVRLFGTLPSFYMKQVVQTLVRRVELGIQVENHCEVVYPQQKTLTLRPSADSEAGESHNSTQARSVEDYGAEVRKDSLQHRSR